MTFPGAATLVQKLGRYHLAEPLGGGPTGEVFRAKVYGVAGFERQFAVKQLHKEFVKDPEVTAQLAASTRMYASLGHPRIARLQEFGVSEGIAFTAVEYVDGLDVGRLIGTTPVLSLATAAAIISQAARAVGYAHGRGISHFGLCPTNLICEAEGFIKVTDFGMLPPRLPERPGNDDSLHARIGYLAPEQLVAEETSSATDVFQLGAIAYELFTGRACFSGRTAFDVSQNVLSANPKQPDLPKSLVDIIMRCLARAPFARFTDARALADALDAAMRAEGIRTDASDVASAIREANAKIHTITKQDLSGAFRFPVGAPPPLGQPEVKILPDVFEPMSSGALPVPGQPVTNVHTPYPSLHVNIAANSSKKTQDDATVPSLAAASDEIRMVDEEAPTLATGATLARTPEFGDVIAGEQANSGEQLGEPQDKGRSKMLPIALLLALTVAGLAAALLWIGDSDDSKPKLDKRAKTPITTPGNPSAIAKAKPNPPPAPADPTPTETPPGSTPTGTPTENTAATAPEHTAATPNPAIKEGKLLIRSDPEGAKVYLDGTLKGKTPLAVDATNDNYRLALIYPGYKLHTGQTDGTGIVSVGLTAVTPAGGPAGIKVRCKKKNRYYVFVNGEDTGQLCPTERIGVSKGVHKVKVYDPVTDAWREFRAEVDQTRRSLRVRVD